MRVWGCLFLGVLLLGGVMVGAFYVLDWQRKFNDMTQLQQQIDGKQEDYHQIETERTELPALEQQHRTSQTEWRSLLRRHHLVDVAPARMDGAVHRALERLVARQPPLKLVNCTVELDFTDHAVAVCNAPRRLGWRNQDAVPQAHAAPPRFERKFKDYRLVLTGLSPVRPGGGAMTVSGNGGYPALRAFARSVARGGLGCVATVRGVDFERDRPDAEVVLRVYPVPSTP